MLEPTSERRDALLKVGDDVRGVAEKFGELRLQLAHLQLVGQFASHILLVELVPPRDRVGAVPAADVALCTNPALYRTSHFRARASLGHGRRVCELLARLSPPVTDRDGRIGPLIDCRVALILVPRIEPISRGSGVRQHLLHVFS